VDTVFPPITITDNSQLRHISLMNSWAWNNDATFIHHAPTRMTFVMTFDALKARAGTLTAVDVTARLTHVCASNPLPTLASVTSIGRGAIQVVLRLQPIWPSHDDTSTH